MIAVEADGRYSLNDRALADSDVVALMNAMRAAMSTLNAQTPGDAQAARMGANGVGVGAGAPAAPAPHVTIVGDANAPHQAVVRAMDAARRLGIASVSIATREEDE